MKFSADFDQELDELALRAKEGDKEAQASILEGYKNLIYKIVAGRGITPAIVGKDNFYDLISEIQLHLLEQTIPSYDPEKGHFRNLLYSSIGNLITTLFHKRTTEEEQTMGPLLSLEAPVQPGAPEEGTLQEIIPDYSTTGVTPQVELLLENAKATLSPVDRLILDYKILGYKPKDIADIFMQQQIKTPRGGIYSPHDVTMRYNKVVLPVLETTFPEEMRQPYGPIPQTLYEKVPPYEPVYPSYRINPETGEKTLLEPAKSIAEQAMEEAEQTEKTSKKLSLKRKAAVLDVLDFLRIHLLYD